MSTKYEENPCKITEIIKKSLGPVFFWGHSGIYCYFFYPRRKSENSACDSIGCINGKDSEIRNCFIKSYQQGIVDL